MGTEWYASLFFLKGTRLAVCDVIHLISLTGYSFLPLNTLICCIKYSQHSLNICANSVANPQYL